MGRMREKEADKGQEGPIAILAVVVAQSEWFGRAQKKKRGRSPDLRCVWDGVGGICLTRTERSLQEAVLVRLSPLSCRDKTMAGTHWGRDPERFRRCSEQQDFRLAEAGSVLDFPWRLSICPENSPAFRTTA